VAAALGYFHLAFGPDEASQALVVLTPGRVHVRVDDGL
jgi:hypothetical protein